MIGWSTEEFRDATIRDLCDALEGWREMNGVKPAAGAGSPFSRERLDQLKKQYG